MPNHFYGVDVTAGHETIAEATLVDGVVHLEVVTLDRDVPSCVDCGRSSDAVLTFGSSVPVVWIERHEPSCPHWP